MTYCNYQAYQTITYWTPLSRHDFKTLIFLYKIERINLQNRKVSFYHKDSARFYVAFFPYGQKLLFLLFLSLKKQKKDAVMKRNQLYSGRIWNPHFLMFGLYWYSIFHFWPLPLGTELWLSSVVCNLIIKNFPPNLLILKFTACIVLFLCINIGIDL